MSLSLRIDSLAIFGSVPRGDADPISDNDVLLVGVRRDYRAEAILSQAGYSPSSYSWDHLQTLADNGSLFLQHLKQESHVQFDRDGRLSDLLEAYRPIADYSHRMAQNLELFEMTNGAPECPALLGWAFDVLAVGIRNHAILQFANFGQYVFSYSALVTALCKMHKLSADERQLLLDLRHRKRQYRNLCNAPDVALETLRNTQAVIERITGADCLSHHMSPEDFVTHQIGLSSNTVHWYYPLRRLEGIYRAMGFTPAMAFSPILKEIELIFGKPSPYCGAEVGSIAWLRGNIEAIAIAWLNQSNVPTAAKRSRRAAQTIGLP